ncbi:hypothetical protein QA943_14610 [Streptomyces sp. B21-097]
MFVVVLGVQLRLKRYVPFPYWLTVVVVREPVFDVAAPSNTESRSLIWSLAVVRVSPHFVP